MSSANIGNTQGMLPKHGVEGRPVDAQKQDAETTDGSDTELFHSESSSCHQHSESFGSMQASPTESHTSTPRRVQASKAAAQVVDLSRRSATTPGSRSVAGSEPISSLRNALRAKGASLMSELMLGDSPASLPAGRPVTTPASVVSVGPVSRTPAPSFASSRRGSPFGKLEGFSPSQGWAESSFPPPGLEEYTYVNAANPHSAMRSGCGAELASSWITSPQEWAFQLDNLEAQPAWVGCAPRQALHGFDPSFPMKKRVPDFLLRDLVHVSSSTEAADSGF